MSPGCSHPLELAGVPVSRVVPVLTNKGSGIGMLTLKRSTNDKELGLIKNYNDKELDLEWVGSDPVSGPVRSGGDKARGCPMSATLSRKILHPIRQPWSNNLTF